MKKALTVGVSGLALAGALSFAATSLKSESPVLSEAHATEAEQAPAPIVLAQVMNYERGPRIIIVPQSSDRTDRASVDHAIDDDDYDAAVARRAAVPPPVRTQPRWGAQSKTPPMEIAPRRAETPAKPRSEVRQEKRVVRHIDMSKPKARTNSEAETKDEADLPVPQPPGPRRTVLSAPPPPAEGPTPIRPTPKFDATTNPKLGARAESPAPLDPPPAVGESPPPAEVTADQPPPGYTPPTGMLRDEAGNRY